MQTDAKSPRITDAGFKLIRAYVETAQNSPNRWEAINEEYEEDAYWSRVDEGRQQAKDRMVGGL